MKLFSEPFYRVKNRTKQIEVRLYDEKRRKLRVGDNIIFANYDTPEETVRVEVIGMSIFGSFRELYSFF